MKLKPLTALEPLVLDEPVDYQESHSPTVIDEIQLKVDSASRAVRERVRRRKADSLLWGSMTLLEQRAAECITQGFRLITQGVSARCQTFERTYGRSSPDRDSNLMRSYSRWVAACAKRGVDVNTILEVLVEGRSPREVDRKLRRTNGVTRGNLFEGLSAYIWVMRWQSRR